MGHKFNLLADPGPNAWIVALDDQRETQTFPSFALFLGVLLFGAFLFHIILAH